MEMTHQSDALTTFESPPNPCRSDYFNDFCFWDPTILGHPGRYGSPMLGGFRGVFWWPSWCINLAETPASLWDGGGKQEKMGGFRCVLGGRSDDSNFPELNWWESGFQLYVYYICMYIYIYKKYLGGLWGKGQGTLWLYVWISRGFCFGSGEEVPLRTFAVGSLALSFPATWFTDSSLTLRQTWIMNQNPGRPFFVEWSTT